MGTNAYISAMEAAARENGAGRDRVLPRDCAGQVADDPGASALALRMAALDAAAWNALRLAERRLTAGRYADAERALVRALAAASGVVDLEQGGARRDGGAEVPAGPAPARPATGGREP